MGSISIFIVHASFGQGNFYMWGRWYSYRDSSVSTSKCREGGRPSRGGMGKLSKCQRRPSIVYLKLNIKPGGPRTLLQNNKRNLTVVVQHILFPRPRELAQSSSSSVPAAQQLLLAKLYLAAAAVLHFCIQYGDPWKEKEGRGSYCAREQNRKGFILGRRKIRNNHTRHVSRVGNSLLAASSSSRVGWAGEYALVP